MEDTEKKIKILIADDSEMNRAILAEMLGEGYEILEAVDGEEALACLDRCGSEISLVLLDIVMPNLDGFGVLARMNQTKQIEEIPVIMISAEDGAEAIRRAYNLGISDYISRPFDMEVVRKRVTNTLMLYAKQKQLLEMVAEQVYEKQKSNTLMVNILSHIVEFRNGESGLHVIHVHMITKLLLEYIRLKTDRYSPFRFRYRADRHGVGPPRHRKDRHSRRDLKQAGTAHRRGIQGDEDPRRHGRLHAGGSAGGPGRAAGAVFLRDLPLAP